MKLKALLLGLAIAASQTGYSMDGIQEPENAACKLVKKFVTITQANDNIEAITNALAEILSDDGYAVGSLFGIQRRPKISRKPYDLMIEYLSDGQKAALYDNLSFSKYAPNYTLTAMSQQSSLLFNLPNMIAQGISSFLREGAPRGTAYIGDDRSNDVKNSTNDIFSGRPVRSSYYLSRMFDPIATELFHKVKPITEGGNITGNLTGTVTGNATNVSGIVAVVNGGTGGSTSTNARTNLGIGLIDNTSDASKPVSTAQQAALDLKANLNSPTFTGLPVLPTGAVAVTQALNDNSTKLATTEYIANALADASGSITNSVADATTTNKGKILLAGDIGGTAASPTVITVGGKTKDEIVAGVSLANNATNSNLENSIVKRDANGAFVGNLTGNATNITGIVTIANGGTGTSTVAGFKTNFSLDNLDNTSDANKPISALTQTALNTKINSSLIGATSGVASLGSDGKIPTAQLPAFSIASAPPFVKNTFAKLSPANSTILWAASLRASLACCGAIVVSTSACA